MEAYEEMSAVFRMLGDRTRLLILSLLRERELCVCEIVAIMQMSQPRISQHLRKLKDAGLVNESKRSQWVYYSLHPKQLDFLSGMLCQLPSSKELIVDMERKGLLVECKMEDC